MKLAMMSDIHANRQAFEACIEHATQLGAQRFALLGDLVGYGADPAAVVRMVRELHGAGAVVIKGNHDAMAVSPPAAVDDVGGSTAAWTHAQLSSQDRDFLSALPMTHSEGVAMLVHASAQSPEKWQYVDSEPKAQRCLDAARESGARRVYVGHVHHQALFYPGATGSIMRFNPTPGVAVPFSVHRTFVATVGSVGQPRDGNRKAMYAMVDLEAQKLTFHRVEYDADAAAQSIRRAGLPEFFAQRLETGR